MFMIILLTFVICTRCRAGPFTNTKGVPEEVIAAMEAKYGLDRPYYCSSSPTWAVFCRGISAPRTGIPADGQRFYRRRRAGVGAAGLVTVVFVLAAAIPMGILAALKNGKWQDCC